MGVSKILIAEDDQGMAFFLTELIKRDGYQVLNAYDGLEALGLIEQHRPQLALVDVRMPGMDGLQLIRKARERGFETIFIVITAYDTREMGIRAIQAGAYDYFPKPFEKEEVRIVIKRALRLKSLEEENQRLKELADSTYRMGRIIGRNPAMLELFDKVRMVLDSKVTVMIRGESGTGKELVAEAIHYQGPRRDQPFIKINCVAIPDTLLESELFGHERGAFTGAHQRKIGRFESANRGTILLDEIGDMGITTQAKLLMFLQEHVVERLGGTNSIPVDVRVIASTNKDLEEEVRQGRFREDLYFRLNVITLHLPPLRERLDDLALLVEHFIDRYNKLFNKNVKMVTDEAMDVLLKYRWPGNVRELENVIQRAVVFSKGEVITPELLPEHLSYIQWPSKAADLRLDHPIDLGREVERISAELEKELIIQALAKSEGKRQQAATLLGISRKTLHNKMTKYQLFGSW